MKSTLNNGRGVHHFASKVWHTWSSLIRQVKQDLLQAHLRDRVRSNERHTTYLQEPLTDIPPQVRERLPVPRRAGRKMGGIAQDPSLHRYRRDGTGNAQEHQEGVPTVLEETTGKYVVLTT